MPKIFPGATALFSTGSGPETVGVVNFIPVNDADLTSSVTVLGCSVTESTCFVSNYANSR
jgi:hypothetical protein